MFISKEEKQKMLEDIKRLTEAVFTYKVDDLELRDFHGIYVCPHPIYSEDLVKVIILILDYLGLKVKKSEAKLQLVKKSGKK